MLELLDFQSRRIVNIIQSLGNNGEQLTVYDIALLNQCSEKTVMNDIKIIQLSWNHILEIEKHNDYYMANVRSQSHIKSIYSEIISQSNSVNILVEIFMNPNQSVHYYANKTNTSITNFYISIKSINSKLSEYNISILNENSIFSVHSPDRTHFRLFFTLIFLEYNLLKLYKNTDILDIIQARVKTLFNNEYDLMIRINFYSVYYLVSLLDIKNNGCMEKQKSETVNKYLKENKSYYELLNRYYPTMTHGCFIEVESKVEDLFVTENQKDLNFKARLRKFISSNYQGMTKYKESERLDTFVHIILSYSGGFNFSQNKLPHFINRYESFASRIKVGAPHSYHQLEKMISVVDEEFGLNLVIYTAPLIYWVTMIYPDIHREKNNKIMVISDFNLTHANFLRDNLSFRLGSFEFDSLYLKDCDHWQNSFDPNKYHRVISTSSLLNYDPKKLIITGDYISTEDLARILNNINKK